jgi:hypothetical protein
MENGPQRQFNCTCTLPIMKFHLYQFHGFLFFSGQVAQDPATGKVVEGARPPLCDKPPAVPFVVSFLCLPFPDQSCYHK